MSKTKTIPFVFALAVMLMGMPFATSNAYAQTGGDGVINPTCGITLPGTINLGSINRGADGSQVLTEIVTTGTVVGTFEVKLNDWTGTGAKAENSILVLSPVAGTDVLTIDGNGYQGVASPSAAGDFAVVASDITTASNLVTVINADVRAGTQAGFDQTASSFDNAVFIRNNEVGGTVGNTVTIVQSAGTGLPVQKSGGTLLGGEESGTPHMDAEDTHFAITTDESTISNSYAAKAALNAATVNKVLSSTTDPDPLFDIFWYLHLTGVDDAATGEITMLAAIADLDEVVINGVTFVAENDGLTLAALEFDILTGGTTALDAAALKTAIDLNGDSKYTTSITDDVVTLTAVKPGAEANALTLTETGAGVTISGSGTFTGGDDAFDNLPFTGGITTTVTFGTRC